MLLKLTEQLDVVMAFLEGRDVFVILPTGFGKSLSLSLALGRSTPQPRQYILNETNHACVPEPAKAPAITMRLTPT